jgi:RHS repeat-associated protein
LPWVTTQEQNPDLQPYKYNGKEFVEDYGLDVTDLGNRGLYHAINRFTTIDRFAEKFPWQSPYVVANNNMVNFVDVRGDSLDVPNTPQSRDDIANMCIYQEYLSYNGNSLSLNFGDKSKKEITQILKEDEGLSILNNMINAKEKYYYEATHEHGKNLEWSEDGKNYSLFSQHDLNVLNTSDYIGMEFNEGSGSVAYMWFKNVSKTPRGDETKYYVRPSQQSGYDAIITVSPGEFYDKNFVYQERGYFLKHEFKESYYRTTGNMPYSKAHNKAGEPQTFSRFILR